MVDWGLLEKPSNNLVILATPRNLQHRHYRRVESCVVSIVGEPDESKAPLSALRSLINDVANKHLYRKLYYVEVLIFFHFLYQHLMLLDRNGAHNRDGWKESQSTRHRKLVAIWCPWNIWRLWTIISTVELGQRSSLVDDWRHCCRSWLRNEKCSFNSTWTSDVPIEDCAGIPFLLSYNQRLLKQMWA